MSKCLFCESTMGPLRKVYMWNKPERYDWYCDKHYSSVKAFQNKQKEDFIKTYNRPESYAKLPEHSKRLYDRLTNKQQME